MSAEWFILLNGQQYGPYTGQQLREAAVNGQITTTTMIAQAGQQQWFEARTVPGLFQPIPTNQPQYGIHTDSSVERFKQRNDENGMPVGLIAFFGVFIVASAGVIVWVWSGRQHDNQANQVASVNGVLQSETSGERRQLTSDNSSNEQKELEGQRKELEAERAALASEKAEAERLRVEQERRQEEARNVDTQRQLESENRVSDDLQLLLKIQESPELYVEQEFEVDVEIHGVSLIEIDTVASPDGKSIEVETLKRYQVKLSAGPMFGTTAIGTTIYFPWNDDQLIFVAESSELGREFIAKFSGNNRKARVRFKLIEMKYGTKALRFLKNPLGVGIARNYWGVITSAEKR